LSFRNDFLTTTQRTILTKAIAEVNVAVPRPVRTIQYKNASVIDLGPESIRSAPSGASSHDTERLFVNDGDLPMEPDDDDLSTSAASGIRRTFSASASVVSNGNFRSFSEAPSSSVLSSTIAPLMANLMTGLAKKEKNAAPSYLSQNGESVENLDGFGDFKASLL
jgi:hypothetical protein